MFGTDAFDIGSEVIGWEEFGWIGMNSSRQAQALTGTENDAEITCKEALRPPRMVLRDNAGKL